ncbi:MAG TPA: pyridoxal-dependent decarboxylase [Terriglobales bacterium]|nr:pyridoxal-dependent decarboxylase [Terriglobales bacterium]
MKFELDSETRRALGYKLIDCIDHYFSSLPDRPVQLPAHERTFGSLGHELPEIGEEAPRVLDEICRELVDKGFHVPSANYFGLMNPTPTYMSVLAEALVAALNPQLATLARSQLASKIENETVRWIGERVFGTPAVPPPSPSVEGASSTPAFAGTFTSGGNEANFSALALAIAAHFPGSVENGVASIGAQPVLYASAEAHHSLDKSVSLLGLGRKALRRIVITDNLQLDTRRLESRIAEDYANGYRPFCVVGTAGTTNSGAIDDLEVLGDISRRYGLWFHVDGAYGAAATFSDKHRHLVRGIERADSVTIDPHKWLAMPFAAGVILTRHPATLRKAFEVSTPYMPRLENAALIDNFKISTQWSRRMNSLKLWLSLRVHGRHAYEELVDRQLTIARRFHDWLEASEQFEVASPMYLPILNFRVKPNGRTEQEVAAANVAMVEEVTRDGRYWISSTVVNGRSVIRAMIISYLTGEENLRGIQDVLTRAANRLSVSRSASGR